VDVKDLRPISPVDGVYKIISKVFWEQAENSVGEDYL
jgi:hypothetical protein